MTLSESGLSVQRRSRPRWLLALAVVVLAVTACGNAVKQFQNSLTPLEQQVQTERSQIAATLQAVRLNDPSGARLLDQQIAVLAKTMAQMTKLHAPSPAIEQALARYTAANRGLVRSLYQVAGLVVHGSSHQLQAASLSATDAAGAVQRASDALDSAITS